MQIFSDMNVVIHQAMIKNVDDHTRLFIFESEFSNPGKLSFLLNSLKKYDDSLKVIRKTIS